MSSQSAQSLTPSPAARAETMKNEAQFWAKVGRARPDDCWPWLGYCDRNGYGRWGRILAHRVAFEIGNALPYMSLQRHQAVCHRCDNPSCCNPGHLWLGTQSDNVADMDRKGRSNRQTRRGEQSNKAKLTSEQAIAIFHSTESDRVLAARFGVSRIAINHIKSGKNWAHATGAKRAP